jgi:hypothetical protein
MLIFSGNVAYTFINGILYSPYYHCLKVSNILKIRSERENLSRSTNPKSRTVVTGVEKSLRN